MPHSEFLAWDDEDRMKALAFLMEKAERCQMCGTAPWEWEQNRHAYEAVEHFCHGCYLTASAHVNDPNRNLDGITIELTRTGTQDAAKRLLKAKLRSERGESQ